MNGAAGRGVDRTGFVDRLADDVHDTAQRFVADRHRDGLAQIAHFDAARQTFGRVHGDGAHSVLTQMLGDFEHEAVAVVVGFQRVQDGRQVVVERDVHNGTHNLGNAADFVLCHGSCPCLWSVPRKSLQLFRFGSARA